LARSTGPNAVPRGHLSFQIPAQIPSRVTVPIAVSRPATSRNNELSVPTGSTGSTKAESRPDLSHASEARGAMSAMPAPEVLTREPVELNARIISDALAPLPSVPLVQAPPAASASSAVLSRPPEMEAVLHALNQYAEALTNMDVGGARRIWPTVDSRALTGAFSTLEKNKMVLNTCAVDADVRDTAFVTCQAHVEFVPRVGSRSPQVVSQQWRFTMNKVADQWKIQTATASAGR
jgi:hypothetical protein